MNEPTRPTPHMTWFIYDFDVDFDQVDDDGSAGNLAFAKYAKLPSECECGTTTPSTECGTGSYSYCYNTLFPQSLFVFDIIADQGHSHSAHKDHEHDDHDGDGVEFSTTAGDGVEFLLDE